MTTDREGYFKAHEEYSKVLRTWFVAYGLGGPVLLLTTETVTKAIKASGQGKSLAALCLAGVALQVVLAALNKCSMWRIYFGEFKGTFKTTRRYRISHWFSEQFWIDLAVDVSTLILFALATWRGYRVLGTRRRYLTIHQGAEQQTAAGGLRLRLIRRVRHKSA